MTVEVVDADWPAPTGVRAVVTTRMGGHSAGPYASLNLGAHVGDTDTAVAANRRRLATMLELPAPPHWLEQIHGAEVADLDALCVAPEAPPPRADAAVTRRADRVCAVLTADCLSVVLASADGGVIGVAHAGWRGLAAGVVERTVAALACAPTEILAWLGPCIGPAAYEVGADVRDAFLSIDPGAHVAFAPNARGRWQADLATLARRRLARAGVDRVYGGSLCTYADATRFYSHRRDGRCGRMATLVWRRANA